MPSVGVKLSHTNSNIDAYNLDFSEDMYLPFQLVFRWDIADLLTAILVFTYLADWPSGDSIAPKHLNSFTSSSRM